MATPPSASASPSRNALVVGFVLVVIGGSALLSQALPDLDRYVPLVVGLGLLALFFVTRSYVALVFAGILTGVGAGLVASDLFAGTTDEGPGAVLGLAGGFIGIWLLSWLMKLKEHHFWPLIPGGILALVGIGLVFELFENDLSRWVVPAIVVGIGLLVMAIGFLRTSRGSGTTA